MQPLGPISFPSPVQEPYHSNNLTITTDPCCNTQDKSMLFGSNEERGELIDAELAPFLPKDITDLIDQYHRGATFDEVWLQLKKEAGNHPLERLKFEIGNSELAYVRQCFEKNLIDVDYLRKTHIGYLLALHSAWKEPALASLLETLYAHNGEDALLHLHIATLMVLREESLCELIHKGGINPDHLVQIDQVFRKCSKVKRLTMRQEMPSKCESVATFESWIRRDKRSACEIM